MLNYSGSLICCIVSLGEFNVYVRTASKYDDCRLLHLPRLKLTIGLTWHCLADPNEHLAVQPCAPNRIPEYSSNQEHDSYRAFRSQSVTLAVSLETKASVISSNSSAAEVHALVYGSTLRWFENLKCILSGVSRPTRRGPLFQNTKPRKSQLSRHYKAVRLALSLHRFHIYYWWVLISWIEIPVPYTLFILVLGCRRRCNGDSNSFVDD